MAQLDSGHEGLSKKNFRTYSKLYRDPELFEAEGAAARKEAK